MKTMASAQIDKILKIYKSVALNPASVGVVTEDGEKKATLRSASMDGTKQFLEIWDKEKLVKNYDLAASDVHGEVYIDWEFGSFQWSPDKTKVLYIAEKKLPKTEAFYKRKSLDKKDKEKKDEDEVSRVIKSRKKFKYEITPRRKLFNVTLVKCTNKMNVEYGD